ncbi:MAG: protein TolR [Alphaproteobacteria bacterium]|nr:protein TolR [Alphaproteobacteria bacterium]
MGAGVINSGDGGGGRRGRRRSRRSQPMSEINVTPFVDVMLVLLIIFMVAAPLMVAGIEVDTPDTAAGALPSEQEEPLAVTLTADGRLMLMTTEVPRGELVARLQGVLAERESDRVFVRADGSLPYEEVAQVMGALTAAGITNISLVTDSGGPALDDADG